MESNKRPHVGAGATKKRKEPSTAASNDFARNARSDAFASKRAKIWDARSIATQRSDAVLKDGQLDLQAFLGAREFEIKAFEDSMRKTKGAASTRAFQKVPRAMRRRTASHNIKRIPKRLRARAKFEQMADNTPTVESRKRRPRTTRARIRAETAKKLLILAERKRRKQLKKAAEQKAAGKEVSEVQAKATVQARPPRPKIRRNQLNDPPKAKSKFKKRQVQKTWLPTHLWLAKRARMTEPSQPLWRFAIPLTPSEKSYRPTHRAANRAGAVAWDTSYMSTVGVYGSTEGIERVLKALGLVEAGAWGNKGRKWRAGTRKWTGQLSKERGGNAHIIGPATVLWNPESPAESPQSAQQPQRQVFIRTHPSCFLELFEELLKLVKMQSPRLYIEDLRFQIGSLELIGPGSTEALLGVLHPYTKTPETGSKEPHASLFKKILGITNSAALPGDAALAFSIMDPRLRYPPRRVKADAIAAGDALLETLTLWPAEDGLQAYGLFGRTERFAASRLPSQKSLDRRKGAKTPGKELDVTASDPAIPIILMASRPSAGGQAQGTWTLLAPWACILPIWYSLVHYPLSSGGNPRLGGLNELRQLSFEYGSPWFPADFPGTLAGNAWEVQERETRRKAWGRRPKGKRVQWKSVPLGAGRKGELGDGLSCDYEFLFGISQDRSEKGEKGDLGTELSLPADEDEMDIDTASQAAPSTQQNRSDCLDTINHMTKSSFYALLAPGTLGKPPAHALITVALSFVGRGVANACARIYRLPTNTISVLPPTQTEVPASAPPPTELQPSSLPSDLREQWLQMLPRKTHGRGRKAGPPTAETDGRVSPVCPDEGDLIGFVTTGAYNLTDGRSSAIGCLSAEKALDTLRDNGSKEGHLCIVRNAGETMGWLARWHLA